MTKTSSSCQQSKDLTRRPLRQRQTLKNNKSMSEVFLPTKSIDNYTCLKAKDGTNGKGNFRSIVVLLTVFCISIAILCFIYFSFPQVEEDERQYMKLPRDIEDAKNLGKVLFRYKDKYYFQVIGSLFMTYLFLQSFAIPGSIFLSIMSGFLFSFPLALFLVSLASCIGASFCYLLFHLVGRNLVWYYMPAQAASWAESVHKHQQHLLNYVIFLRITPFLPNWFINITAPVINVPLKPFFWGTFIGVMPPSFVAIQAGTTLQRLTSSRDTVSWTSLCVLFILALVSLIPVFFKQHLMQKMENGKSNDASGANLNNVHCLNSVKKSEKRK